MSNTVIQLKKSGTPGAIPASLAPGELGVNYVDGKLYYGDGSNTAVLYSPGGGSNFGTINADGTLVVSDTDGDVVTFVAGSNMTIVGDAVNDKVTFSANLLPAFVQANTALYTANLSFNTANSALFPNVENQIIVGGATITIKDLGFANTGSITPDPGDRQMQRYRNGGAHSLLPGSLFGNYLLTIVNVSTAGAITVIGWTKTGGDAFTTTNGHIFRCHCVIDGDGSTLVVMAMQ